MSGDDDVAVGMDLDRPGAQRLLAGRRAAVVEPESVEVQRTKDQGSVDLPSSLPDPIFAGFLALEVAVGAHGAHPF